MADEENRGFRRDIGLTSLLFVSVGSIIGSGWLFGALYASQQAGPAALLSWALGAVFMVALALVYAELGGTYAVAGGTVRFPQYSHGTLVGYAMGWLWWLGAATVAPIEVEAALQYFTHYESWLTTSSGGETVLTAQGYGVAVVLMALFTVVNVLGVRWLARANTPITAWKIAIPTIALIALMVTRFHGSNFHAAGGFMPFGWHGVFSAMATGGVIFAYQGFEQAVQLGGESANPKRNLPLAVIGSMAIGVVLYMLLQVAFLAALDPANLHHGWAKLAFNGLVGPFAGLASSVGLGWLAVLLYIDAAVSPGGTGLLYTGASARVSYALARSGWWPRPFTTLSARGIPIWSTLLAFIVGVIVFLPFPGWQKLVGFITAASSLSYATSSVAAAALRLQDPDRERPFKLPFLWVLAPFAFVVATLVVYWSGWPTVWRLMVALAIGGIVFTAYRPFVAAEDRESLDTRHAVWLVPYLGGITLISYFGRYAGRNLIPFWIDLGVVTVFSLAVFWLAIRLRLPAEQSTRYVENLDPVVEPERHAA
ncbi:MAG TPA: APC family permease [Gaiellaceae bacterium]|nr:APC family permease [Gaiellaceae bacterium]